MKLKSFLLIFLSLSFSIGLVLFSTLQVHRIQAQSQFKIESVTIESTSEAEATGSGEGLVRQDSADYYMAYPGILPDHPLYWLKMLRDRILLLLTNKPVTKTERLLLYADKRLGAAKALIEGGKIELGITTLTKGEKYLEEAVNQYKKMQQSGVGAQELEAKLVKASLKHNEILGEIMMDISGGNKELVRQSEEKVRNCYEQLTGKAWQQGIMIQKRNMENEDANDLESAGGKCSTIEDCVAGKGCNAHLCLTVEQASEYMCRGNEVVESPQKQGYKCSCIENKCQWTED